MFRKLALLIVAVLAIGATSARAQIPVQLGGLMVPLNNPYSNPPLAGYATLGSGIPAAFYTFDSVAVGDSVRLRTILRTGTTPGAGVYTMMCSMFVHDSGTAGRSVAILRHTNGIKAYAADTLMVLGDSLSVGTEVTVDRTFYQAANDSVQFKVYRTGFTGSPTYTVHCRLQTNG